MIIPYLMTTIYMLLNNHDHAMVNIKDHVHALTLHFFMVDQCCQAEADPNFDLSM